MSIVLRMVLEEEGQEEGLVCNLTVTNKQLYMKGGRELYTHRIFQSIQSMLSVHFKQYKEDQDGR